MEFIDATPTWLGILPLMLTVIERAEKDKPGYRATVSQFEAMAKAADAWNAHVKAQANTKE